MVKRIIAVLAVLLVGGAVVVALQYGLSEPVVFVQQPIAFNHLVHIEKAELDCTTICHSAALEQTYAGLPSKDVCYECHDPDEETPDEPEKTRLAGYVDLDEDIPWERVARTREHVFFSHRRHVVSGEIECARCHPGVAQASQPLSEVTLVVSMDDCIDCHEQNNADVDCLACHR